MKQTLFLLLFLAASSAAHADHITGGELYYTYTEVQGGSFQYNIVVKVFMRCNSGRQFNNPTVISIFDKGTNARVRDIEVSLTRTQNLMLADPNKCITDPPVVCYEVGYYEFSTILPPTPNGYVVASQFVFRIGGIRNLTPFYDNIGTTYMGEIPGTIVPTGPANNSAQFTGSDLVVVCANNSFSYSFAATDPDGDELRYSFCDAYQGGAFRMGNTTPPTPPPFLPVPYGNGFSGASPLGPDVQINNRTGMIKGLAPNDGIYVVTVCVQELRNGRVIATQRKDLQIFIASCTIAAASLLPAYNLCRETTELNISNQSTSPLIQQYNWEVADRAGNPIYSTANAGLQYNFRDTGLYQVKLVINRNGECADSVTSAIRVYPGMIPDFDFMGVCTGKPTRFSDVTTTRHGRITGWQWDFGNGGSSAEELEIANPEFTYPEQGNNLVTLTVANSNGCVDTVARVVAITDKPPLELPFRDTTICITDRVQLMASGPGIIRWSPQIAMQGANTNNPVVSPEATTTYYSQLDYEGCTNQDSVIVRVANGVSLQPMADTTICTGDTVRIRLASNAITHNWDPVPGMLAPQQKDPLVQPGNTTTFQVRGTIGSCTATASVTINTVPYPVSNAGKDTLICFGTAATLNGNIIGASFSWSSPQTLTNPQSLFTTARPAGTTAYILQAFDNRGCPKPTSDTVLVQVMPPVSAIVTNDTSAVLNQPLQLSASGGATYQWTPATGLSATDIPNPIAIFSNSYGGSILYQVRVTSPEGCSDSASVLVKVYETGPNIFVPTAFSPNNDGLNDRIRPLAAGILRIERFLVFNRLGQQVFSGINGTGWDGRINGQLQPTGVYVWMVQATDFNGRPMIKKGTTTLIR